MTETNAPKFTCEICGREGDYNDFLDLNDDDWNDPFTIYTVCPQCYEAMWQKKRASFTLYFYPSKFNNLSHAFIHQSNAKVREWTGYKRTSHSNCHSRNFLSGISTSLMTETKESNL